MVVAVEVMAVVEAVETKMTETNKLLETKMENGRNYEKAKDLQKLFEKQSTSSE